MFSILSSVLLLSFVSLAFLKSSSLLAFKTAAAFNAASKTRDCSAIWEELLRTRSRHETIDQALLDRRSRLAN